MKFSKLNKKRVGLYFFTFACLLASATMLAAGISGCSRSSMKKIEAFTVTRGDIIESITSTGTVDASKSRNYSLTQSAEVLEIIEKRNASGFDNLSQDEKALANEAFWLCLRNKGQYMIEAFKTKVLPKLNKVHSTQEFIELDNGEDKVIGYIDIVAEVQGHEEPIVLDVKTSAMHYEEDSVVTSPQLSLYVHAVSEKYKTKKAGYIVLNKNLIKNRSKTDGCMSYEYVRAYMNDAVWIACPVSPASRSPGQPGNQSAPVAN